MAGGGGGSSKLWINVLVVGAVLTVTGNALHWGHTGPGWLIAVLLALGGLAVVFASCEAMIKCVEGIAARLEWNQFVAGTMAGLASNVPELVMLGFVIAQGARVGFIVVAFTLHVGAMAFGIYSAVLPRDRSGHAKLPDPMVKLSTDLYACAAGAFLATGALMLVLKVFDETPAHPASLTATDLYVIGGLLLMVQAVALLRLVRRFSSAAPAGGDAKRKRQHEGPIAGADAEAPSVGAIAFFGLLGLVTSVVGGHAVGDFADMLVEALTGAGYSENLGALILSIFASAGAIAMIATAHTKRMYDIALANVSGWINQVPFVVLPVSLILIAAFGQLGVVPSVRGGGVLLVDHETTAVFLLAFPPLLILWKAVQDDGKVSMVETTTMIAVFGLTLYFLALR